jgi:hypothetical protein
MDFNFIFIVAPGIFSVHNPEITKALWMNSLYTQTGDRLQGFMRMGIVIDVDIT